ncbi:mono-functional DNA-alkylating methyl methanesulfonate N-term-domain-containing protein [Phaeosphaeriaceae sp. PMI808]|nr:mono-functional DNA-alkylating methyl methanesulfonate N-term-domain-containing protein [Phaeosphaeriaceae sp. PMI808]
MNHQVQHLVLVDNEWVSRPVDVYQIMAHARNADTETPETITKPTVHLPELGLLSRTVFASPLFKAIRPANIRHKNLNDVVLVGEDSVQLNEIHDYGHLRCVATKSDFNGRILAVRVFGNPREIPAGVVSSWPKKQTAHRGRRSMIGDDEPTLPPEVIVLTLSSRTLMFLWARHTPVGAVTFSKRTVRLPAGASRFDRFGSFLAIDPKCRAMAVAPREGRFALYKTKSIEAWREELRNGKETTPIQDERIIALQGRIMHMEFLSPASGEDEFHVVLLFIIVIRGKTKITCFDWDCREDLSKVAVRTERVLVDMEDHNPSLLIPLSRTSEFLLVFDTHISVYIDILSGVPRRIVARIDPSILSSLLPGDSKHRPRWVEWDKTPRNPDFPKESFYVAREDGRIMYVERGPANTVEAMEAGDWPHRIDTAFACLSVDNSEFSQSYPDVLIAGGAGNDGRLCKFGSWPAEYSYAMSYPGTNQLSYVESITNWTPLMDLSITPCSVLSAPGESNRHSIVIAHGSSPHGEISEMRYGVQSNIDHLFNEMSGCVGLWAIDHGSQTIELEGKTARQYYAMYTVTMPQETWLVRIARTQREIRGEFSGAWEDGNWETEQVGPDNDGVIRAVETISACPWNEGFAIQITGEEIRILSRPSLHENDSIMYTSPILRAACRPNLPFVAVTYRESNRTYLEVVRIMPEGRFVRAQSQDSKLQLTHEVTCIELLEFDGIQCIFASTADSTINFVKVDDCGGLSCILKEPLESGTTCGTPMILESAVSLLTKERPMLVCATRDGFLLSSPLPVLGQRDSRFAWHVVKMGTTSARITASSADLSTAFISCGPHFCRVRCSIRNSSKLDIDSIWFTNPVKSGYIQPPITAVYQLPLSKNLNTPGRNLGGFLLAVGGDQGLFSQLDINRTWTAQDPPTLAQNDCQAVPRKLLIGAKPTVVTYIKSLNKMVIATMEAKEGRAPPHGYRVLHSAIKLIKGSDDKVLDAPDIKMEDEDFSNNHIIDQFELKHGERVYSITEWVFINPQNKRYSLIIVGTGVPERTGKETGRRLVINIGKHGKKLQLQKESVFEHPVYCTVIYDNASSVTAYGRTLTFDIFEPDVGSDRLKRRGLIELQSPGVHITVNAPFVYVSTLQHSHICYEIVKGSRLGTYEFRKVFSDSRERNCSSHLVLDINYDDDNIPKPDTIVLATDKKSSSIVGLYHPPERTYNSASPTIFEACLPRTVVRIQNGDIRPPWRRPSHPSHTPTGILNNDIIGTCSDGTIYAFSILSPPARHLLRLLQNLIQENEKRTPANQDVTVLPRSGAIRDLLMNGADGNQEERIRALDVDPRQMERRQAGARYKHVDGDLLLRWMDEGEGVGALLDGGTEDGVKRVFEEFVGELWGEGIALGEGVRRVEEWLEGVFLPVL